MWGNGEFGRWFLIHLLAWLSDREKMMVDSG
jgi:hypothetical protein